ncbi:hypothetical protein K470DRAFT_260992 [Piedraia hortae CBS 480.64]|uniref:Uncharacterized protein n=1 Tax=Piedraia hortae CBS 480.64 TaxID=1314780 RepID=A0A6A7BPI0_9PEZI|nr:hypothetical protein K470DRAFT_260992 [Piedraia hortae CBS 480.64]
MAARTIPDPARPLYPLEARLPSRFEDFFLPPSPPNPLPLSVWEHSVLPPCATSGEKDDWNSASVWARDAKRSPGVIGAPRPKLTAVTTPVDRAAAIYAPRWPELAWARPSDQTTTPSTERPISECSSSIPSEILMDRDQVKTCFHSSSTTTNYGRPSSVHFGDGVTARMNGEQAKAHSLRRPANRDEFDGPSQFLEKPIDCACEPQEEDLPTLPASLTIMEQDEILAQARARLSQCAFDFVARYQFPIPLEPDRRPVRVPGDREWSEWVYLLKRLATKRRIPARVLYQGQIKQFIMVMGSSLEMRHVPATATSPTRTPRDDRHILQLLSSGLQVAKILKDAAAMQDLDSLYMRTERLILSRRASPELTHPW